MTELELTYQSLSKAFCPFDVYGKSEPANRQYRALVKIVHPDHNPTQLDLATRAFELLQRIHKETLSHLGGGTYNLKLPFTWKAPIKIGKYVCDPAPVVGGIVSTYSTSDGKHLVRVTHHHDDNDLALAEKNAITTLSAKILPPVRSGLPVLADSFQLSGKRKRNVNVFESIPGFLSLEEVKKRKGSIDSRTAVWLFKRCLVLLGWVSYIEYVNGAITPANILVFPDNLVIGMDARKHIIKVVDWCYSVGPGRTRLSAIVPYWESLYAPELLNRKLHRTSDTYMAANTLLYVSDKLPASLESILEKVLDKDPNKRYSDNKLALLDWSRCAEKEFGKPKFHEFII